MCVLRGMEQACSEGQRHSSGGELINLRSEPGLREVLYRSVSVACRKPDWRKCIGVGAMLALTHLPRLPAQYVIRG